MICFRRCLTAGLILALAWTPALGQLPPEPPETIDPMPPAAGSPELYDGLDDISHEPQVAVPSPVESTYNAIGVEKTTEGDRPVETITERYANRRVKIQRQVAQDAERNYRDHGPWSMWSPDGTLIAKGTFDWGKRNGKWMRLYLGIKGDQIVGDAKSGFTPPFTGEADFVEHQLHGTWKIVDAKGRPVKSWQFENGRLHGIAVTYFANGKKRTEGTFEDGHVSGSFREWNEKGQSVRDIDYRDGRSMTPYLAKHKNGQKHYEGQFLGPRKSYNVNVDFWNGSVEVRLAKSEGKPSRNGEWTEWFENGGKKFQGTFEEDRPVGRHIWWYANGQKRAEGNFDSGKENGLWTWWHLNGLKQLDGRFVNGVQQGEWIRWDEKGRVQEVQEHRLAPAKPKPIAAGGPLRGPMPQLTTPPMPGGTTLPEAPNAPVSRRRSEPSHR